jgi:Domain of unknown function (DUF4394)
MPTPVVVHALRAAALAASLLITACASMQAPEGPPRKETVLAATVSGELIRFNAGQPSRMLSRVDFNPVADRIRVVTSSGRNLRLHPDSGALAAEDAALRYADGDAAAGAPARVGAAAYTYNKNDSKLTTNYAIDVARGTLLRQGSLEGAQPVVSPNSGLLATVGALGTGAVDDAAFDIADVGNTALAALRQRGVTRLHLIDLASGRATALGRVADGQALAGLAIEP